MGDNNTLNTKQLSQKLITLLCLLSGQRGQTIWSINTDYLFFSEEGCTIKIPAILKTTTPQFHVAPLIFKRFPQEPRLCVVSNLRRYLAVTSEIRGNEKRLFISFAQPFKPVTVSTIRRWITTILENAGINTQIFGAHSTRAAGTSKAYLQGIPLVEICRAAGWKNASSFATHYNKEVIQQENFGDSLLRSFHTEDLDSQ